MGSLAVIVCGWNGSRQLFLRGGQSLVLQGTRSTAHQLLSQVFINCSILILVRQSMGFCKFRGKGRDLISLLVFLLRYCRSLCSTTNTFWLFFFYFYLFVYLFSSVYLVTIDLLFHRKNFDRRLFCVKLFKNQLGVKSTTIF